MNAEIIERTAQAFLNRVRVKIGQRRYVEAVARNANAAPGVCHFHDFCDANECMAAAILAVTGKEMDTADEAHSELFNAAWSRAHALSNPRTAPKPYLVFAAYSAAGLPLIIDTDKPSEAYERAMLVPEAVYAAMEDALAAARSQFLAIRQTSNLSGVVIELTRDGIGQIESVQALTKGAK